MNRTRRWLAFGLFSASIGLSAAANAGHPFLRRPQVRGDQIVFTSEGDLWLAALSTGLARRVTNHPGQENNGHFSPDGKMLAFDAQYDGGTDAYVMPVDGGVPKRLTWDPRGVRVAGWTPDSANVLFLSRRANPESQRRLWKVPATGGLPALLPIPRAALAAMAPDGKTVAYVPVSAEWQHWKHYKGGQADDIWITDISAKTFRRVTTDIGNDTTPAWAGGSIYFISERNGLANLYRLNPANGSVTAITHYTDAEARYPASDGKTVVFQHGDGLAKYDIATNKVTDLTIQVDTDRIHAREKRIPMAPALNTTTLGPAGKRVLAEARGQLLSLAVEEGDARVLAEKPGSRSQHPAWSRDGKSVAFISDRSGEDQMWVAQADGAGTPRQLTKDHEGPLGPIRWSPDGKYLVTSDREARIILVDVKTGATTLVDQADRAGSYDAVNDSAVFSPDGKWLAFNRIEPNWNVAVYIYDIAKKQKTALTSLEMNSYAPAWDAAGKLLYFLADRNFDPQGSGPTRFFAFDKYTKVSFVTLASATKSPFQPKNAEEGEPEKADADKKAPPKKGEGEPATPAKPAPSKAAKAKTTAPAARTKTKSKLPVVKIDLVGLTDRIAEVPVPGDRYQKVEAVEDRLLMLVGGDPGSGPNSNTLRAFNLKDVRKKEIATLASGIGDFEVSADRKKVMIRTGRALTVVDASTGPVAADAAKVDLDAVTLSVNPPDEWKQMFHEAWRLGRDFFYDPNLHGVNWNAVRTRYAARLGDVADRSDLNEVLGDMIAELVVGHAYVGGGDVPEGIKPVPMGYLGADFEPDPSGKAYKITKILRGDGFDLANRSPLLTPGLNVKEGDFILAVSGRPVHTDEDIQALLAGAPGRVISLTVNSKPVLKGSRQIRVRPLADESKARYYDWSESRREYVRKNGGPNLGYIHLPDMGDTGLIEFTKHYYSNVNKDGMIYDSRFNSGGYISAMLLQQISRKPYTWFKPRYGASWTRQDSGFAGYSVALCNENSFSNGEEFPDAFQREKLGPVIGVRTWGGEVGSGGGYPLIDGGKLYIPNYAEWADGKWIIEGPGFQPDITVEQNPVAVLDGRDPQLDRAIEYLKEQIARKPVPRPTPPPFPVKAWKP